jgi:hypothetical protein
MTARLISTTAHDDYVVLYGFDLIGDVWGTYGATPRVPEGNARLRLCQG